MPRDGTAGARFEAIEMATRGLCPCTVGELVHEGNVRVQWVLNGRSWPRLTDGICLVACINIKALLVVREMTSNRLVLTRLR